MKFSCEKALLQSAVMTAGRVVAAKSSILALEGVLVEAEEQGLRISGYNLETGIVTSVEASVDKKGAIVLPSRLLRWGLGGLLGDFGGKIGVVWENLFKVAD